MNKELYGALFGDACLYMGMLANLTMDTREVDACQDTDGRLWRNPEECAEGSSPYAHGTSRDMMLGFVLGTGAYNAWKLANYLKRNGGRLSPGGDGRTLVTASGYWQLGKKCGTLKGWSLKMRLLYLLGGLAPRLILLIEMLTAWKGYQYHLTLVTWWLYLDLGVIKRGGRWHRLLTTIALERSGGNHLALYLSGTSEHLEQLKKDLQHVENRYKDSKNHFKDGWDAAFFQQWLAHRHTSALYVEFAKELGKKVKQ